jgi:plasmid rolling circle replication initiator protein Rep
MDKHTIEFLRDTTSTGKERDWKGKKRRSVLMAEHFHHANLVNKAERMQECANVLTFKQTEERLKLFQAWFCKVRLCPMCNWRRSLKIAFHNKTIVEEANRREKVRWLFLTLTVRNCEGSELKNTIDDMMKSWNRFMGYKKIKVAVKGYFRALEVTKNRDSSSEWNGTYHPHFHVLLAVKPSYFTRDYIKHEEWVAFWKKAMKLDYEPLVNIQKVKPKKELNLENIEHQVKSAMQEQKAILEVSKYPVKDTDVLPSNKLTEDGIQTVGTLDDALSYKRLIAYGGLLKDIHKELNLGDAEDGDLIRVEDGDDQTANAICEVMAYWNPGLKNYVVTKGE